MIFTAQQLDEDAGRIAAEANVALAAGDTSRAAKLFREAGKKLEAHIPNLRKESARHLQRFLAATQYYHGGAYQLAGQVGQKVQRDLLPVELRPTFDRFQCDVRDRSAPSYPQRVQQSLQSAAAAKDYERELEILRDHPFTLRPGVLAYLRAECCEELKNYRAAALFFADAVRFAPDDPHLIFNALASPLALLSQGKMAEAWDYVQYQLAVCNHPIPYMNASMVRQREAYAAYDSPVWHELAEQQVSYCRDAWTRFETLPPEHRQHRETRNLMALCLEAAVFPLMRTGSRDAAMAMANHAVVCDPDSFSPWTARGIATYPSEEAIRDFRTAVALHDPTYCAYYYLAHASFMTGAWSEAVSWFEQALAHQPSRRNRPALLEMLAIARAQLGHDAQTIESLFREALSLEPANLRTAHNLQVFLNARTQAESSAQRPWDRHGLEPAVPTGMPMELPQPMPPKADLLNGAALAGMAKA